MKTFYSEYVQHCMRFYARFPQPKFRTDVDEKNWNACDQAIKDFTNKEQYILMSVYQGTETLPDNVYNLSTSQDIKQDTIWKLVNQLERKIAKRRGLI